MPEVLVKIGYVPVSDRTGIEMSTEKEMYILNCTYQKWSSPFAGARMNKYDIKELIAFLLRALEDEENE